MSFGRGSAGEGGGTSQPNPPPPPPPPKHVAAFRLMGNQLSGLTGLDPGVSIGLVVLAVLGLGALGASRMMKRRR